MGISVIVGLAVITAVVVSIVVLFTRLAASRRRSREYDAADLEALRSYATARQLTVVNGADKRAFLATGELEGIGVSLSTSHLEVVMRGRTAVGPLETHLRARGLPADARMLTARPTSAIAGNTEVHSPLTRGADLRPTGDAAYDASFRSCGPSGEELARWLDPTSREELRVLPQVRELRLGDGELSISLVRQDYVGGARDETPWNHVHPVVKDAEVLDAAARILARIHANLSTQLS